MREGCIAEAYSLYSEFPYSKVYSYTLPAVVFWGQWHRDMVGTGGIRLTASGPVLAQQPAAAGRVRASWQRRAYFG